MNIKPQRDMELFLGVMYNNSFLGKNLACRFGAIALRFSERCFDCLVQEGSPFQAEYASLRIPFLELCAGHITANSFNCSMESTKKWLVEERGIRGHSTYRSLSWDDRHPLWIMACIPELCLSLSLHKQIKGVQDYLSLARWGDDRKEKSLEAERILLTCVADLFLPTFGDCFELESRG